MAGRADEDATNASETSPTLGALSPASSDLLARYCVDCHEDPAAKGDLDLKRRLERGPTFPDDAWEKIVRKLRTRQMPPPGRARPPEEAFDAVAEDLEGLLDRHAARHPDPGTTHGLRRLGRTEYRNAVRDLLGLEIDVSTLLPKDDDGHGFDNPSAGALSPTLLSRYLAAAEKIARLAVGLPASRPSGETFRNPPDLTQESQLDGLPPGTRGGILVHPTLPSAGEYEIQARLTRDRNEEVEGLREPHEIVVLVDREPVGNWTVAPPKADRDFEKVDAHLKLRLRLPAGPHALGVTFLAQPAALVETRRQPYHARYNMHRHPRLTPAIQQVSVTGPFGASTAQDTPSRRRIFVEWPTSPADEDSCARRILDRLVRKAYRRPVADVDCLRFLELYREAKTGGGFEAGIEAALAGLLASPEFLFRLEPDDPGAPSGSVRRLGAVPLASRVSFLIWSSLPDEALLAAAEDDTLLRTEVLRSHVLRLLADSRSANLASNFAGQWLQLRNLDAFSPDLRLHPDFDENLRRSFRGETERLFREIVAEDRSVLELLRTDHTFLDERLAKHYGIPHVYGPRFRRVAVASEHRRGGILRHGGILCVTSYATRTSPVLRGNWILGNLLGTPPPPPPPNVPPLRENAVAESTSVRERLARHRADPACAGCHRLMDPVGFALENFDAIGRWRDSEDGTPLDASGGLPDGSSFVGVDGLEDALAKRPDLFVGTLVEKLLVFALGRGLTASDAPAVRAIVREAEADDYRFSSIISGIVRSTPFTHRKTP